MKGLVSEFLKRNRFKAWMFQAFSEWISLMPWHHFRSQHTLIERERGHDTQAKLHPPPILHHISVRAMPWSEQGLIHVMCNTEAHVSWLYMSLYHGCSFSSSLFLPSMLLQVFATSATTNRGRISSHISSLFQPSLSLHSASSLHFSTSEWWRVCLMKWLMGVYYRETEWSGRLL